VKAALVISERDNVATALEPLAAGREVPIGTRVIVACESIPSGHKIAIEDIAAGQPVVKYGSAIGTATSPITKGSHVHTHNLASGRGRGDLGHVVTEPEEGARLAEPPDSPGATTAELVRRSSGHD
jgi:altronate dehydratase small subunit